MEISKLMERNICNAFQILELHIQTHWSWKELKYEPRDCDKDILKNN
jgi:hypothetical protein